jgi:hypothetical protein
MRRRESSQQSRQHQQLLTKPFYDRHFHFLLLDFGRTPPSADAESEASTWARQQQLNPSVPLQ